MPHTRKVLFHEAMTLLTSDLPSSGIDREREKPM